MSPHSILPFFLNALIIPNKSYKPLTGDRPHPHPKKNKKKEPNKMLFQK